MKQRNSLGKAENADLTWKISLTQLLIHVCGVILQRYQLLTLEYSGSRCLRSDLLIATRISLCCLVSKLFFHFSKRISAVSFFLFSRNDVV